MGLPDTDLRHHLRMCRNALIVCRRRRFRAHLNMRAASMLRDTRLNVTADGVIDGDDQSLVRVIMRFCDMRLLLVGFRITAGI